MATAFDLDGAGDRWLSSEFLADISEWLTAQIPFTEMTQRQIRPWGTVFEVSAQNDRYWLKANAEGGEHEPRLMRWLHKHVPGRVPATIAHDDSRNWWLATDVGGSLDRNGEVPISLATWQGVLRDWAAVQRDLESAAADVVALGIPLHDSIDAAEHFDQLLADKELLLVGDPRGLTAEEYSELRTLQPDYERWCIELDSAAIPNSLQHDDLSGANICGSGPFKYIDWADTYVGNPFGSLVFPERIYQEQHGLDTSSPNLMALRRSYLEAWTDVHDMETLLRVQGLAVRVATASKARSWNRALHGIERAHLNAYYASPEARWLRRLLSA